MLQLKLILVGTKVASTLVLLLVTTIVACKAVHQTWGKHDRGRQGRFSREDGTDCLRDQE
jgi:hypothetical protein